MIAGAMLFDLFLRSGVYREYAEQYMKPEQIDSVDLAAYLESPAPQAGASVGAT